MTTLGEVYTHYQKLKQYSGLLGRFPMHNGNRYFGIEIEMENIHKHDDMPGSFQYHKDHSLKVNGAEYVTVPIQCKFLEVELSRLFSAHPDANFSSRCSVHYHMNVRDMKLEHLKKFIILYLLCERQIYKFSGDRWDNIFCVPAQYYMSHLILNHNWTDWEPISWGKYTGMNLLPMETYGTIEFRMSKGTKDIKNILTMINIFSCLKSASMNLEYVDIKEAVQSHDVRTFLERNVFKSFWDLSIYNQSEFTQGNMMAEVLINCTE